MLNCSEEETNEFVSSIINAKKNLKYCSVNVIIYLIQIHAQYVAIQKEIKSIICVVEDVRDVVAMEKTHEFKGVYHVLHGSISPMNGVGPDDIKIKELLARLNGWASKRNYISNKPKSGRRSNSYVYYLN